MGPAQGSRSGNYSGSQYPANVPQTYSSQTSTGPATTSAPPLTLTTIAPLGNQLPVSPLTLPLRTNGSNAHVDPAFAIASGAGLGLALLIVLVRLIITRAGGSDRQPVQPADGNF